MLFLFHGIDQKTFMASSVPPMASIAAAIASSTTPPQFPIEIANALLTTATLLSSFVSGGLFVDWSVFKPGIPYALFNVLCIFLGGLAMVLVVYVCQGLEVCSTPLLRRLKISDSAHSILVYVSYVALYLSISIQFGGLSYFLYAVICIQLGDKNLSTCPERLIGVMVPFGIVLYILPLLFIAIVHCCRCCYGTEKDAEGGNEHDKIQKYECRVILVRKSMKE